MPGLRRERPRNCAAERNNQRRRKPWEEKAGTPSARGPAQARGSNPQGAPAGRRKMTAAETFMIKRGPTGFFCVVDKRTGAVVSEHRTKKQARANLVRV